MRFMENFSMANDGSTGTSAAPSSAGIPPDMSSLSLQSPDSPRASAPSIGSDYHHITASDLSASISPTDTGSVSGAASTDKKARLLYCKSHVAIHPTTNKADNVKGYLGIVEVDAPGTITVDREGNVSGGSVGGKELLVAWVPEEVVQRMDEGDRAGYEKVDSWSSADKSEKEEDGFVFVSIPPPKGEKYAFSVPVSQIYSILVLSHWYGSATFNLAGGISLPTLYFHDDESPMLATQPTIGKTPSPRAQWGFPPFINLLATRSSMLQSRLITPRQNQGAELWLVNPSKADREVHEAGYEESPRRGSSAAPISPSIRRVAQATGGPRRGSAPVAGLFGAAFIPNYPPAAQFPASPMSTATPKQTLMMGLSNLTNFTRKAAKEVLNHPFAQPVVPHLPPAVRSMVNVRGEGIGPGRRESGRGKDSDVAAEFESARLYLARWARVVAEEGERARRQEVARSATLGDASPEESLAGSLGVFSLLSPGSKKPVPAPTRHPDEPIHARDWDSFAAQARDELFVRREIFRRGFATSEDPEEKRARREGWEVLLDIVKWDVGDLGVGEAGKEVRRAARQAARERKRAEYDELKRKWKSTAGGQEGAGDAWREEWHRIDVDCRRTDRNQKLFEVPAEVRRTGSEEKEGGGASTSRNTWDGKGEEEEGGSAGLNSHVAALRTILMTYHTYSPELGYVQGMSDLLAPIYVVFEANEADAFWGLVGLMEMMESNFLRDQSGMKRQLSTLQKLIGVMDPELYDHLNRTGSLNLFFCFRWILISFKREFAFEQVIRLWEVLWTNYYSDQFNLFVALAILQSHRDVIIRYLKEFDEVLKYANDLSGQIDLDTTLAQAEVLFLIFRGLVEDLDKDLEKTKLTAGTHSDPNLGVGIRKRRGSGFSIKSDKGDEVVKGGDVAELRGLVKGWGQSVKAEEDLELVLSLSRKGSGASTSSAIRLGQAVRESMEREKKESVRPETYLALI